MPPKTKKLQLIGSLSIAFIGLIGLLVGTLGVIPRCDSLQTKAAAAIEHVRIRKDFKEQQTRIEEKIEKHHLEQREGIKDLHKTLWEVYREVKK